VTDFAAAGANDFSAVTYEIGNVSGRALDSVYVGFFVDQDVGPAGTPGYWQDDVPEPLVPQGDYVDVVDREDPRYDARSDPTHPGGFCKQTTISVRGFALTDDDGDDGAATGASCFLLLDHTTDLRGQVAPTGVGFRTYRIFTQGVPYVQGGAPTLDLERYEAMSRRAGTDGAGRVTTARPPESLANDWFTLCSVGPFPRLDPGERVTVTVALAVFPLDFTKPARATTAPGVPNRERYGDAFDGALAVQKIYRGRYETPPPGTPVPHENGRETPVTAPRGTEIEVVDCHFNPDSTGGGRTVRDNEIFWANFDCDYCTGVKGKLPKRWVVEPPPPAPGLRLTPGNRRVILEWDNRSEWTPDPTQAGIDPAGGRFDFHGYRIYRAAGYTRPVGTIGPSEEQWELVADLVLYDELRPLVDSTDTNGDDRADSIATTAPVLLDVESGARYLPRPMDPLTDPASGDTLFATGKRSYLDPLCNCVRNLTNYKVPLYPVGRYVYTDTEVLNGFVYFYAVTARDSTGAAGADGSPGTLRFREGRRVAVEADGVVPQDSTATFAKGGVYVVPNPYRGRASWDLTPSPSDPSGTHVDFHNLPRTAWTIRIFTISGDLVQTIHSDDVMTNGKPQRETLDDGQASWNLISRNGQDVVSGIYLFSVTSSEGTSRGRFVIVR
ncbi:MAG: hypothetical protein ACREOU_16330, partial [Candidatus Eiseniibacteriota bacterium]